MNEFVARNGIIANANSQVIGALTANTLIKLNGTSDQYLMADGSVSTLLSTSGVTGIGTPNFVSKWSSTSGLTNSQIFDNGTNVGIGITNPFNKLHILGNSFNPQLRLDESNTGNVYTTIALYNQGISKGALFTFANYTFIDNYAGAGGITFRANGSTNHLTVNYGGNVLIGTFTDNNTDKLQVNGSALFNSSISFGNTTNSPFIRIGNGILGDNSTNAGGGDIYAYAGNLYVWGVSGAVGAVGTSGGQGTTRRSLTGLGLDYDCINNSLPFDFNTLPNAYGRSSLASTGYAYQDKLVNRGYGNIHPDMYQGALYSINDYGNYNGTQLFHDWQGQIFARGTNGMNGGTWNKYVWQGTPTLLINTLTDNGTDKLQVNGSIVSNGLKYNGGVYLGSGVDLNSIISAGFYSFSNGTNAPINVGFYYLTVETYLPDGSWSHQTVTSFGVNNIPNRIYTRVRNNTVWTPWLEVMTSDGTTSNSILNQTAIQQPAAFNVSGDSYVNGLTIGKGKGNDPYSTALGVNALVNNTTGSLNTALGYNTLAYGATNYASTAVGVQVLQSSNSAYNTGFGYQTLISNTYGGYNDAFGTQTLSSVTDGSRNSAFGYNALSSTIHGYYNVAMGMAALGGNEGSSNTALGYQAGRFLTDNSTLMTLSNNSIFIGYNVRSLGNNQTNQTIIGFDANGLGSNTVVLGNDSVTKTALKGNVLIGSTGDTGQMLQVNGTSLFNGTLTVANSNINVTGIGNIQIGSNNKIFYDASNYLLHNSGNGWNIASWSVTKVTNRIDYNADYSGSYNARTLIDKGYLDSRLTSSLTGAGTTNYIPYWNSANSLGNSPMYIDGTSTVHLPWTNGGPNSAAFGYSQGGTDYFQMWIAGTECALQSGARNLGVGTNGAVDLYFKTNGAERARFKSGGNLLIGTTTDNGTDKLQINGNVLANTFKFNGSDNGPIGVVTSGSSFNNISSDGTTYGYGISTNILGGLDIMANQANQSMRFWAGQTNVSPTVRMQIAGNTGNILINTSTDNGVDRLQVNGNITSNGMVSASGVGGFASSTYAVNQRNPIWRFSNSDGYGISYFQGTAGVGSIDTIGLHFGTPTAIGSTFAFLANGTLLINNATNNSIDKLQVNGSLIATSIKMSGGTSSQFLMADGSVSIGGAGGGIGGSGTANYISKWSGASALTNSQIFDNGTNIGIGVSNSIESFNVSNHISGVTTLRLGVPSTPNGIQLLWDNNSGNARLTTTGTNNWALRLGSGANNDHLVINNGGNVSIGTTSDNGVDKLQVAGSANFTNKVKTSLIVANGTLDSFVSASGGLYGYYSGGAVLGSYSDNSGTKSAFSFDSSTFSFRIFSTAKLIVNNTGNVLINTSTDNGVDNLQVNGSIIASAHKVSGGLNTQFLKADGSVDSTVYATDSNTMHLSGNESFVGTKSSNQANTAISITNSGSATKGIVVSNTSTGTGLDITMTGGGLGLNINHGGSGTALVTNITANGNGFNLTNGGTGVGFVLNNNNTGIAMTLSNSSTGKGLQINNSSASAQGNGFEYRKNSSIVTYIADNGNISAPAFVTVGGNNTQVVLGDGTLGTRNSGTVTGLGTLNFIPRWSSSSNLQSGSLYDDGTNNVVVGGTTPLYTTGGRTTLTVNGSSTAIMVLSVANVSKGYIFHNNQDMFLSADVGNMTFATGGGERMRVSTGGALLISTITDNGTDKLQVNGSARVNQLVYTRGINLASSTDLNGITDAGFYDGSNLNNAPNSGWFYIKVERYSAGNTWVHQTATEFGSGNNGNRIYSRVNAGGTWGGWAELSTTASSNAILNQTASQQSAAFNVLNDSYINGVRLGKGNGSFAGNIVIGNGLGAATTNSTQNTIVGMENGKNLTTGTNNNFFGYGAGTAFTTGNNNNAFGNWALVNNTIGSDNIAIGTSALGSLTSASIVVTKEGAEPFIWGSSDTNIAIGTNAGLWQGSYSNLTAADACIFIGKDARALSDFTVNETVIGSNIGKGSNTVLIGSTNTTDVYLVGNARANGFIHNGTANINAGNGLIKADGTKTAASNPTFVVLADGSQTSYQVVRGYKCMAGTLVQIGTNLPTMTIMENTFGTSLTWSRIGAGNYNATMSTAFVTNKTLLNISNMNSSNWGFIALEWQDTSTIKLATRNSSSTLSDGVAAMCYFEIRVYY